jgi:CDP-paratose 2-epimerase
MSVIVITGSLGLIGSEAALYFGAQGMHVVGIDNDMRKEFFGEEASTAWNRSRLERELGDHYRHHPLDIRDRDGLDRVFSELGSATERVLHAAAQPSHDWAARAPVVDFEVNANGTLNTLEATRKHCPEAAFAFCSTNKVYGDRPNSLPLEELETRFEIAPGHPYANGIPEDMDIDRCLHSLFGASKLAADVLTQEYGRYYDMKTACFRGGTLTGPGHSATELHGFLAYVVRCAMTRTKYTIFGYKGKQVRDAIHSHDLIRAFEQFFDAPRSAEVYNIGGGRFSNVSVLEAIDKTEKLVGAEMQQTYNEANRVGDHIWWIGDNSRFQEHYPGWRLKWGVDEILTEIYEANAERWKP